MEPKLRILAIRLMSRMESCPGYAARLGMESGLTPRRPEREKPKRRSGQKKERAAPRPYWMSC